MPVQTQPHPAGKVHGDSIAGFWHPPVRSDRHRGVPGAGDAIPGASWCELGPRLNRRRIERQAADGFAGYRDAVPVDTLRPISAKILNS